MAPNFLLNFSLSCSGLLSCSGFFIFCLTWDPERRKESRREKTKRRKLFFSPRPSCSSSCSSSHLRTTRKKNAPQPKNPRGLKESPLKTSWLPKSTYVTKYWPSLDMSSILALYQLPSSDHLPSQTSPICHTICCNVGLGLLGRSKLDQRVEENMRKEGKWKKKKNW